MQRQHGGILIRFCLDAPFKRVSRGMAIVTQTQLSYWVTAEALLFKLPGFLWQIDCYYLALGRMQSYRIHFTLFFPTSFESSTNQPQAGV